MTNSPKNFHWQVIKKLSEFSFHDIFFSLQVMIKLLAKDQKTNMLALQTMQSLYHLLNSNCCMKAVMGNMLATRGDYA